MINSFCYVYVYKPDSTVILVNFIIVYKVVFFSLWSLADPLLFFFTSCRSFITFVMQDPTRKQALLFYSIIFCTPFQTSIIGYESVNCYKPIHVGLLPFHFYIAHEIRKKVFAYYIQDRIRTILKQNSKSMLKLADVVIDIISDINILDV